MATTATESVDSPEVRRYNRIHRWLSMADAFIGLALLVVLLVTGWTGKTARLGLPWREPALLPRRLPLRS